MKHYILLKKLNNSDIKTWNFCLKCYTKTWWYSKMYPICECYLTCLKLRELTDFLLFTVSVLTLHPIHHTSWTQTRLYNIQADILHQTKRTGNFLYPKHRSKIQFKNWGGVTLPVHYWAPLQAWPALQLYIMDNNRGLTTKIEKSSHETWGHLTISVQLGNQLPKWLFKMLQT